MSDLIEVGLYNPGSAPLGKGRPSPIIKATECFHPASAVALCAGGNGYPLTGSSHLLSAGKLTSFTRALLIIEADPIGATSAIPTVFPQHAGDSWLQWSQASEAAFLKATESQSAPNTAAQRRVDRLAAIQGVLGLSTSDLAQVLHLSRPGLYKWLDASSDVKLQGASRERLALIERIAQQWRDRSNAPLSSVAHEPLADGRTILSMMFAKKVDETLVVSAYDQLLTKLAIKPKSRSQMLADRGFKRRPSARSLPSED